MSNKISYAEIGLDWVSINNLLGVPVGERITLHNVGVGWGMVLISDTPPLSTIDYGVPLTDSTGDVPQLSISRGGSGEVWVKASDKAVRVLAQAGSPISINSDVLPSTVLQGLNAITVQDYSEANRKNGTQWSASRILTASNGQIFDSIIKTTTKPVDLKSRVFAYTGLGLFADIFTGATYTGGVIDPVYSCNGVTSSSFDFQLLSGITVTGTGTKFAPTIYAIGETSNQSKGKDSSPLGSNYILAPNTTCLLRITSKDNQDIAARIEGYNGILDLPFNIF